MTFQVVPAQGQTITALTVNNGGSATQKTDGSWTVTVENVQEDIILNATVASGIRWSSQSLPTAPSPSSGAGKP